MKTLCALLIVLLSLSAAKSNAASDIQIDSFTLDNGLRVLVIPNHRVPAISHMLWFPSGGADDPHGKSGLAHFHEHVMFKGTPNFAAGEFETIISRQGGNHNAFTTYDTTGYYVNIPKEALGTIMELEADRIRGIVPSNEDIIKERQVILEERRMRVENNPRALFSEQINSILFVHHPYGTPLIGWMSEMQALDKQDVMEFHQNNYTINNATLILAGDITAEQAKPLVKQYYGGLEPGEPFKADWVSVPPIRSNKRLTMDHLQIFEPLFNRSYIAPSFGYGDKADAVPLMVFAQWLGGGHTSYLYQRLVVEQKIATSIYASYSGFNKGPETFTIGAVPAKGVSLERLEAAIDATLATALKQMPAAQDVTRAKTLLKAETLYAREGLQGVAYIVGWLTMLGQPVDYINQWPKEVEAVTPEQMLTAATRVLTGKGHVTGILLPAQKSAAAAEVEKP